MMQLWAPQGDRTCVVIQASLLSQVATRLSICPVLITGSKAKTTELLKSYKKKNSWALNL
jgi:mRNA-degrading endonuclease toxin of MazEF toxin-antitoxin module